MTYKKIIFFYINKFIIILFLNLLMLFINIYFYWIKKINLFKNIDNIIIFFSNKPYEQISNILNNKYLLNKKIIKKNETKDNNKKIILIDCVDFLKNSKFTIYYLQKIFAKYYIFKITSDYPDYLIYDVFGCEHLNPKYNNSIKIAYYSENIIADFNQADYILSQAHFIYLDRYFKYPSFIWRLNHFRILYVIKKRKSFKSLIRKKFCAAVISNNHSTDYFRLKFIKELNNYKKVDMGGYVFNNIGGTIKDKINFLSSYKFSISMENTNGDGYLSEKIIESLIAGTIPIYYGDYMIDEYINPKIYILITIKIKSILSKIRI